MPPVPHWPTRRTSLLLLAALPAACGSPSPNLYTLLPVSGPARSGAPRVIELRSVGIARYLERSQIVRSSEDYRLDILGEDWWGEPLDAMLTRILVQNLTQRLSGSTVYPENSAVSASPDATLGINVQRMDLNKDGAVVLTALISVMRRSTATRTFTTSVTPTAAGTPGLVAAISVAVGQLADRTADLLTGR